MNQWSTHIFITSHSLWRIASLLMSTDWELISPSQSPAYYRVPPHNDSPSSLLSPWVLSVLGAYGLTVGNPHRIQIGQCSSWHRERLSSTPHHPRGLHLLRGQASSIAGTDFFWLLNHTYNFLKDKTKSRTVTLAIANWVHDDWDTLLLCYRRCIVVYRWQIAYERVQVELSCVWRTTGRLGDYQFRIIWSDALNK